MNKTSQRKIVTDVILSNTDQRDFISFCSLERNPGQQNLFIAVLVLGLMLILLRKTDLPWWISFVGGLALLVLLFLIWRQRLQAAKAIQGNWIVKNRLRLIVLDEEGIAEIEPEEGDDAVHTAQGDTVEGEEEQEVRGTVIHQGRWEDLPSAFENNRYFYIFRDNSQAFILQKNRMTETRKTEIGGLIAEKMGKRFSGRSQ